ncbi:hypothetical protein LEP1GSC016_1829 [Leptospira borgpetersenii serovar Hardjo-bovis str. Sponselee]|uniref:Uncharacterized protein n=1 Tax=Leptospira borgpetersenii serovar Hardjo-bovis str. Sponselee TaxID=1303729 RepID=M6BZH3_LEPBO|nr:hypothetical protein LBK6_02680 [Leptospira borgpetersenii serovar Hardjo]AWV69224.1 hypothetical protein B9T54_02840 [Leptospira borgpetersenii serovar Hardjo-bovis]EMJ79280.1 hypothetical protein LEP1GSC016_1829 [Leptospira borgpetersenii serovar Hardjo-bovis str. Sponselee]TQE51011.1 hypothetical protein FFZ95_16095 [Leptospira borgpetersenii]AMX60552.1 hypothetical protein LBK9_02615 [Leptospira borgpetersenii serovar Hardjo]
MNSPSVSVLWKRSIEAIFVNPNFLNNSNPLECYVQRPSQNTLSLLKVPINQSSRCFWDKFLVF